MRLRLREYKKINKIVVPTRPYINCKIILTKNKKKNTIFIDANRRLSILTMFFILSLIIPHHTQEIITNILPSNSTKNICNLNKTVYFSAYVIMMIWQWNI